MRQERTIGGTALSRAAFFTGLVLSLGSGGCGPVRPDISLDRSGDAPRFAVTGLPREELDRLRGADAKPDRWQDVFSVHVAGRKGTKPPVPLFGDYRVKGDALLFEPRFPLKDGLTYRAVLRVSGRTIEESFALPVRASSPSTVVRRVYPTRGVVPENLLKFYLHFSAPMARGEAYRRIRLLKADGRPVELPFLELDEELWDPAGTRLTVFFDPGRIKRGLKPREEVGPVLEEGKAYTLVIDREWLDASGRPLKVGFRRPITSAAPDDVQPDAKNWELRPPRAGTRDPLTVRFSEPLDHAMLERVLWVVDKAGKPVAGAIEVDSEETRWRYRPRTPWRPGGYALVAETTLEDLAGNSIGRPFEVDVFRSVDRRIPRRTVRLPFEVKD